MEMQPRALTGRLGNIQNTSFLLFVVTGYFTILSIYCGVAHLKESHGVMNESKGLEAKFVSVFDEMVLRPNNQLS